MTSSAKSLPSQKHLLIGVDPGLGGAIAFYDVFTRELESVVDMPIHTLKTTRGKDKREIDLYSLALIVEAKKARVIGAVIEQVGAAPGQGVSSMFNFGFAQGAICGVVSANFIPIHLVKPVVWKSLLGLTHDKNLSRQLASRTFPRFAQDFSRVKDDGRAEAALLSKFGERLYAINTPKQGDIFS